MSLDKRIYYVENQIIELINSDFELLEEKGWYLLYKNKFDGTFWRLDRWDKLQEQFFLKIDNIQNWEEFDSKGLQISLLVETRGNSNEKCIWKDCKKSALQELAYCEIHAFENMGIRR